MLFETNELTVDLMGANSGLNASDAHAYAQMIIAAQAREDYPEALSLIDEALFGSGQNHSKDSDCTVDPKTECCTRCGVHHGEACPACAGRGFHNPGCPRSVAA